jgi:hypothetical protein
MKTAKCSWPAWAAALALILTVQPGRAESQGREQQDKAKIEIPAAVLKAIKENAPGAEIDKVEVEENAGVRLYDIEFKDDQGEIEVAADGTVIDIAAVVQMKDIPRAAAAALEKAVAEAKASIRRLEKSEIRAEVQVQEGKGKVVRLAAPRYVYEAEVVRGKESGEITVDAAGKIVEPLKWEQGEEKEKEKKKP